MVITNVNEQFGMLRGLSDIYICEVTDTDEAYTPVGTPQKLIPAGEMTAGKSFEKSQNYFDNVVWSETGRETPTELSLTGAALKTAYLAWLEGKEIDEATGAVIDTGDWKEKYYAISGKKDYTDGHSEYFQFLKCSFGGAEESSKTADDTTDSSGMSLPFTAYKTKHKFKNGDGAKVVRANTTDSEFVAEANWNEQVVTPDNLATIVSKKATA